MASHSELRPDDSALPLLIASAALSKAESRLTVATGTVVADNADGTQTWIGSNGSDDTNGVIKWVGDLSAPGRPLGLSAACSMQCVVVSWDGTLENGVPSDFAYIEVFARREGSVDDVVSWGRLSSAGMLMSPRYDIGTVFDVYAIAYDDAHDSTGMLARNQSEQSDLITVAVEQDADMEQIDAAVEEMSKKADEAGAKAEQVRKDLQSEVDSVKADAEKLSQTVEKNKTDLEQSVNDVNSSLTAKLDSATADLDKSVQEVDSKADAAKAAAAEAQSKAESVESDLDSANATIEQHSSKLGELTTKVTNAGTKADSAVTVATEAKQTATEASTTATSAYNDSQTALTQSTTATQTATSAKTTAESAAKTANDSLKQSSTAVQTANQVSTKLSTEYRTKADADKVYATQSSVTQTSDSIKSEVAKTYATKDALTALQNVADNAIESWRGSGVPTLSNKPASDWTTDAEKKKHSGDLYYDKSTGKAYRFGSDDGTTYSWELNQDSDVTKALQDASKAQSTADGAQSTADKANTAAGKAQSTANTAVNNAATAKSAADAAQSSANTAQSDVDKLKVDIPATYATKSSVEQTASEITASVESVKTTANGAVTAASKAQQTADNINVNLTKNYQTKANADATYATQANLKATSDSLTASVSKAQSTADGAVTAASKAQQTADAVTLNLSKNYSTKAQADSTYATQTNLKATSDSLTAKITANATKAQSALDKSTSLEANLNGFKTTVSETYATNAKVDDISVGGTNMLLDTRLMKTTGTTNGKLRQSSFPVVESINGGTLNARGGTVPKTGIAFGEWAVTDFTLGDQYTLSFYVDSDVANIVNCYFYGASGYATVLATACSGGTIMKTDGYGDGQTKLTIAAAKKQRVWVTWKINASGDATIPKYVLIRGDNTTVNSNVYVYGVKLEKGTKPTDWSPAPEDLQTAGDYATNSSLTQTANSITAKVNEVATTASGAMSKATSVEQTASSLSTKISEQATKLDSTVKTANEAKSTADSNKTTISQVSTTASNALSKATTVESGLNGFKTTVSKTYQTKADMSSYSTKSYVDETSKSVALGVVQDYKGADGSGLATKSDISTTKDNITSTVAATYATKDNVTKEISSKITQNNSSLDVKFATQTNLNTVKNTADSAYTLGSNAGGKEYITNGSFHDNLNGWTVDDGQWAINGGDNALQYYKAVSAGASTLGPRQDPSVLMGTSTRQRLIRRSFDIANYSNASGATLRMSCRLNDGTWSGEYPSVELDSAFSWMHVDMVETIPAGKYIDHVVPVIRATNACMINVEVRNFSLRDVTDSYTSSETVVNMTLQGVRVGRNKNGKWNGPSSLVNAAGSFDILDASGNLLTRINQHRFQVRGDSGVGSGYVSLSQDGINITVQPTADTSKTYYFRVGSGGISITSPDGAKIVCSATSGLELETTKYGVIRIGSGGLQFTNNNGWGLNLSAAGWSMKWAGNHVLATGPTAGALYIDGKQIVTK